MDEIILSEISLELLQDLFNVNADNPVYDSFPITKYQEAFFRKNLGIVFDFDQFEYFLEYDA